MLSNSQIFMLGILVVFAIYAIIGASWYSKYKKDHPESED